VSAADVVREHAGGEAVLRVVGQRDRVVAAVERDHDQHRAEDLLAGDPGLGVDVGEHGGPDELPLAVDGLAARHEPGVGVAARCQVLRHPIEVVGAVERAHVGVRQPATQLAPLCDARDAVDELVVDVAVDQGAVGGRADLARVREDARRDPVDRVLQVGVGVDDRRVLAAEFEGDGREGRGRGLHHALAGGDAAGEGDRVDTVVARQRRARLAGAGDDVDRCPRDPRLVTELREVERRQRGRRCRLRDDGVARDERRRHAASEEVPGEVPRDDLRGDAVRLPDGEVDLVGPDGDRRPLDLVGRARVVFEVAGRSLHIRARLRERLPLVEALDLREFVEVFADQIGHPADQPATPHGIGAPPVVERRPCGLDRGVDVRLGALGDLRERLAGRRVDGLEVVASGRLAPLAADEVSIPVADSVGRHVGTIAEKRIISLGYSRTLRTAGETPRRGSSRIYGWRRIPRGAGRPRR